MATIDIRHPHTLTHDAARAKAEELARDMKERMGIDWRWDGDHIRFDAPSGGAKGTTGSVEVSQDSVRVQIDLPFMLRAMKGMVESKVRDKLGRMLG